MSSRRRARRQRRSRAPFRLYLVFFVGWALASALIVRGAGASADDDNVPAYFFVAGTGVLVLALINRDAAARKQTQQLLDEREALIQSMGSVTDPRLSQLPLYQLLDELLERARSVLRADTAAVYLTDQNRRRLRLSATVGAGAEYEPVVEIGNGFVGHVAATRRGATADSDRSVIAAPLVAEGVLVGVVSLCSGASGRFGADQLRVLQVVADRAAVAIDASRLEREAQRATLSAEGARHRLALLADAGEVLASSYDHVQEMVQALADALVPAYGDWFAFHDLDQDGRPRLLTWAGGPDVEVAADGGGDWTSLVDDLLADGEGRLLWGDGLRGEQLAPARARGLTSLVAQPVALRGVRLGTLMFGTAGGRRGMRPGDVATVGDLAARLAVAIERVLLANETQQSAVRAARHALQLQRLAEAASAVNAALDTHDLAAVVAWQAARVLDAHAAAVNVRTTAKRTRRVASHGKVSKTAERAASPITDTAGGVVGSIEVARAGAPFSVDEQAVLASLAQIASVALANARLYEDVHDREARLRALYDASPIGVVEVDDQGHGIRWNRAAEAIFGWPVCADEVAGAVDLPPAATPVLQQVLEGTRPTATLEVTLHDIEAQLIAVPLARGGVVVAAVDLTERKHVEEQLQLAQRMEVMASMAGGIAHDFNNVLMVITGYADLILRRDLDAQLRDDVEAMKAAASRAAEFTRKLLTISRRQVVQPQRVDVGDGLESLRDVLDVMIGSKVALELRIDEPPAVWIDPSQFEQLVINLAFNARDAMPDGGTLTVTAGPGGRGVVLTVADTGHGMDAAALERCFEPFFTTKDRTKGTGLGLSTVYGVVTQAGGDITVESQVGSGTVFRVELPAAADDAAAAEAVPRRAAPLRILVVDDEPDVRAVVADMLELEGHEVLAVGDGETALKHLKRFRPDVLLSDVVMAGMRGDELAARAVAARKKLRVILMSSHVDDDLALGGAPAGTTFLGKPFSPGQLADALHGAMAAQGSKR